MVVTNLFMPFFLTSLPFTKITEINIGFLSIQAWGFLVALGMLLGLFVSINFSKKIKFQNSEFFYDIFFWIFLSSILGARLFYVFLFPEPFLADPKTVFYFWEGGMVFYGGILAAIIAIFIFVRKKKVSLVKTLDVIAPGMAFGIFIGRLGCYSIGDHIGSPTDFFLGSLHEGVLRHEPSLYLSINGLVLFALLWFLRNKLKDKVGSLTALFLVWYSISRFFLDFTRATDLPGSLSDPRFYGMTISQYISIAILLFAVPMLWMTLKRK